MTASARWRRRGVPPAPQASAAVGTPRALWPIGSAGADKERSASAGFSGGREVGVSSPGAPSSSWTEARPRRPLLQPVNRGERGDRAAIPASPPARRPGFSRPLASPGGSQAIRVPRPYRSRLRQRRDHFPTLAAHSFQPAAPTAGGPREHNPIPPAPRLLRDPSLAHSPTIRGGESRRPPTPQSPLPAARRRPRGPLQLPAKSDLRNPGSRLVQTSERSPERADD